jgi:hypothetical protein
MLAKTSNTTRLVDKLLKEYVTRKVCPGEKIEVLITQKGLDVLALDPKVIAHEQFFQNLHTDEIIQ